MELLIRSLVDELVCIMKNPNVVSNLQGLQKKNGKSCDFKLLFHGGQGLIDDFKHFFKKKIEHMNQFNVSNFLGEKDYNLFH